MNLTGRFMDAAEAERSGLVSRVVPTPKLIPEAMAAARKIAEKSQIATKTVKEAVNRAYETTLREGLLFERRSFHALFATEDQKEGMAASWKSARRSSATDKGFLFGKAGLYAPTYMRVGPLWQESCPSRTGTAPWGFCTFEI